MYACSHPTLPWRLCCMTCIFDTIVTFLCNDCFGHRVNCLYIKCPYKEKLLYGNSALMANGCVACHSMHSAGAADDLRSTDLSLH